MSKIVSEQINMPITADYVDWSLWECVREFLQNAKDADTLGYRQKVTYNNEYLTITSFGASLTKKNLMLGGGDKKNKPYMIGGHSEGFKLAALGLCKLNRHVIINNYTNGLQEQWIPTLSPIKEFDYAVGLSWSIVKHYTEDAQTRIVVVIKCTIEEWEDIRKRFLWLNPPNDVVVTAYGDLILDPEFNGKLFVKGINIETKAKYQYSFNLCVQLDRDRRLANPFDLAYNISQIWDQAIKIRPELAETYLSILDSETESIGNQYFTFSIEATKALRNAFNSRFGEKAVFSTDTQNAGSARAYGYFVVDFPTNVSTILSQFAQSSVDVVENAPPEILRVHRDARDTYSILISSLSRISLRDRPTPILNLVDFKSKHKFAVINGNICLCLETMKASNHIDRYLIIAEALVELYNSDNQYSVLYSLWTVPKLLAAAL